MMEIKRDIETNIPAPKRYKGWTETLRKMKVGDSITFAQDRLTRNKYSATAAQLGYKLQSKSTLGVTRLWRVE